MIELWNRSRKSFSMLVAVKGASRYWLEPSSFDSKRKAVFIVYVCYKLSVSACFLCRKQTNGQHLQIRFLFVNHCFVATIHFLLNLQPLEYFSKISMWKTWIFLVKRYWFYWIYQKVSIQLINLPAVYRWIKRSTSSSFSILWFPEECKKKLHACFIEMVNFNNNLTYLTK